MSKGRRLKGVTNAESRRQAIMRRISQRLDTELRSPFAARIERVPGRQVSQAIDVDHIVPMSDDIENIEWMVPDPDARNLLQDHARQIDEQVARALALPSRVLGVDYSRHADMTAIRTPFGDIRVIADESMPPDTFRLLPPVNPGTMGRMAKEPEPHNPFEHKPGPRPLILDED